MVKVCAAVLRVLYLVDKGHQNIVFLGGGQRADRARQTRGRAKRATAGKMILFGFAWFCLALLGVAWFCLLFGFAGFHLVLLGFPCCLVLFVFV